MSYPPIYVISLKRTPERRLRMQRELDALNLRYQFVEAIDKYGLRTSQAYRKKIAHQFNIDMNSMNSICSTVNITTLACSLSHIKIYNLIIEEGISQACILEDDAHLLPDFTKILIASSKVSWEVLMLSHKSMWVEDALINFFRSKTKRKTFYFLANLLYHKRVHRNFRSSYFSRSIFLYIIRHILMNSLKLIETTQHEAGPFKEHLLDSLIQYYACKIGSIPGGNKSSWHKLIPNRYIAEPFPNPLNTTCAMGYLLTHSAAIKWKNKIISDSSFGHHVDIANGYLYCNKKLDLRIIVPPCIVNTYEYLLYSTRRGVR